MRRRTRMRMRMPRYELERELELERETTAAVPRIHRWAIININVKYIRVPSWASPFGHRTDRGMRAERKGDGTRRYRQRGKEAKSEQRYANGRMNWWLDSLWQVEGADLTMRSIRDNWKVKLNGVSEDNWGKALTVDLKRRQISGEQDSLTRGEIMQSMVWGSTKNLRMYSSAGSWKGKGKRGKLVEQGTVSILEREIRDKLDNIYE